MKKGLFLGGLLFTLAGGYFSSFGIKIAIETHLFLSKAIPAQGTVIDLAKTSSRTRGKTTTYYSPVVKFTTKKGESVISKSHAGSNPPSFTKGQQVEVFYDPQNPQSALLNHWFEIWGAATIITGISSTPLLVGGWLMFSSFSRKS